MQSLMLCSLVCLVLHPAAQHFVLPSLRFSVLSLPLCVVETRPDLSTMPRKTEHYKVWQRIKNECICLQWKSLRKVCSLGLPLCRREGRGKQTAWWEEVGGVIICPAAVLWTSKLTCFSCHRGSVHLRRGLDDKGRCSVVNAGARSFISLRLRSLFHCQLFFPSTCCFDSQHFWILPWAHIT